MRQERSWANQIHKNQKQSEEKKEIIHRIIKDGIIRDIWTLYQTEEEKREKNKLEKKKKLMIDWLKIE